MLCMRSRASLFALFFVVSSLVLLPLAAHAAAAIPFFGPIIPPGTDAVCPAGWGMVMVVINNIISFFITIAIVFVAPLMIGYAGFLMVFNPTSVGDVGKAKTILWNTAIGIVIALAGWVIVAAIMAVLYNPNGKTKLEAWSNIIGSHNAPTCHPQKGALPGEVFEPAVAAPGVAVVPGAPGVECSSILPVPPLTDPLAQQMENGQTIIWENTDPRLQACATKFSNLVSAVVTSAYRPQAYQTHFSEIKDRWCTQGLRSNTDPVCSSLKSAVSIEVTKHFGSAWNCGAVGETSRHTSGTGVDFGGISNPASAAVQQAASQSCLKWQNYPGDPYHYDLISGCSCQ